MNKYWCNLLVGTTLSLLATIAWADQHQQHENTIFRVTLLGTGTPQPQERRGGYSTLIEAGKQKLVFDFGRGAATRLWQMHIPIGQVNAFFLTHFHSDHTVGLADLWLTGWLQPPYGGRKQAMQLYGPQGIVNLASGLQQAYTTDIGIRHKDEGTPLDGVKIDAVTIQPGTVYDKDGVKVIAFNNDHGVNIKPSFGYKIIYKGHSVVLSGDTRYSPEVVKQAQHADLLVHCVSLTSAQAMREHPAYKAVAGHLSSPQDAARVFSESKPKLAVFSHIGLNGNVTESDIANIVAQQYTGPFVIGEDLMHFDISTKANNSSISIWQTANH